MSEMKIGVVGCAGRMGRLIAQTVHETDGAALAGGVERAGSAAVGQDLGELAGLGALGLPVGEDASTLFEAADAVVDFTTPEATLAHAKLAAETGTILVVGTTGTDAEQDKTIEAAAQNTPIVRAANMSLGVNLLLSLVERTARALSEDFDIEIVEMHHRHKVDAPSGTALALGKAAAAGRGVGLDAVADRGRDGHTGERRKGDIGFAVLRGGDVPGEHTVVFAGAGERIELTHKAGSRAIFAQGAVKAALWAAGKPAGLYSMQDVLGLAD